MTQPNPNDQYRTRVLDDQSVPQQPQQQNQYWGDQPPAQQSNQPTTAGQVPYQVPGADNPLGFREESNKLPKAIMLGIAVMLVGAITWGALAYFTGYIILYIALAIGWGISYALLMPFRKPVSKAILVPLGIVAVLLTIVSVMLGSYLSAVLIVMRETAASLSDGIEITNEVFFTKLLLGDHLKTIGFGLGGALLAFFRLVRG